MDFPINSYIRDACIISHISLHEEKEAYVILQLKQNEIGDRKGSIALLLQNNIEWLTDCCFYLQKTYCPMLVFKITGLCSMIVHARRATMLQRWRSMWISTTGKVWSQQFHFHYELAHIRAYKLWELTATYEQPEKNSTCRASGA